ncbi:hypothetical protein DWG14_00594 [Streptomyces griseorubiginosus]|jgi:hypothetical protein|uniref:Uncharacterized protein n=1 Tax=Streptomyces griseorubiginosus TaxID=67304 RepID=A0AAI8KVD8_9ACTN|nr:hypothetical protein DWG14_00594 [Streptomyces griseorubiginosus]
MRLTSQPAFAAGYIHTWIARSWCSADARQPSRVREPHTAHDGPDSVRSESI